jgi:tRNA threonylcarbamoyladenosine biosynthesis protein TsaB
MEILAVDTASKSSSAAVVSKDRVLAESILLTGETHSKTLMGLIGGVLQHSGIFLDDIDAFAVTTGPGSFTGLRIGISIVKGLASSANKPIAGISALDALALQVSFSNYLLCPMLDARRNEVYFARYRCGKNGEIKKETEDSVDSPEKVISTIQEPCLFLGDGSVEYHDLIAEKMGDLASFAPVFTNTIRASAVGHLGSIKIKNNDTYSAKTLEPVYLRKSDAEINKK